MATNKRLADEAARLDRQYGYRTGALGTEKVKLNVFPTGILALDYALGTGGFPRGYLIEVFGPEDIGKSSAVGWSAVRGAQNEDALCGIIALEPNFDERWVEKNGVDLESVVIARPDTGEDAFNILYDWVKGDLVDLIVFDSIGALLKGTEIEVDEPSKKAKPSQAGQSPLITWGVKRITMPAWKNNKTVIFINQVRDKMNSTYPMLDSPGGHALKHCCSQRIQLKPGRGRDTEKIDGDNVIVGREIIAEIVRNKLAEGTKQRAVFQYWQKDNEKGTVGVDAVDDLIRTGKKTGVISGSGYYESKVFPKSLHGKAAVRKFLNDNPKAYDELRNQIINVMLMRQGPQKDWTPDEG